MAEQWEDLSDSELRSRLRQRNPDMSKDAVDHLVRWRDAYETSMLITKLLEGDDL